MGNASNRRPWQLWVVGILSLIWNSGGAIDYTMSHLNSPKYLAGFSPEQLAWFNSFPVWATSVWALGVWGAFAGSLLLLFRSSWAVAAFGVALFGLLGTTLYQWAGDMPQTMRTNGSMIFNAVIWIVTGSLFWYAIRMKATGILS